ncbi:MAG: transcription antitermination factor NusB [Desulfobacterales bacterium]|nr:transcription antitermination factor NusB [Desulfobacterales bacterium]MBF0398235.1 transcription antitermination factor NusB [Desulfobacterales bacterium]
MGTRRKSREFALQALFYMDTIQDSAKEVFELFCTNFNPDPQIVPFAEKIIEGVIQAQNELDAIIERFSANWKVYRMPTVDRNILRIALYEMLYCTDIPYKVAINEAIDIAKDFSSEESGAFVNGILDSIRIAQEKGDISNQLKKFKEKEI